MLIGERPAGNLVGLFIFQKCKATTKNIMLYFICLCYIALQYIIINYNF